MNQRNDSIEKRLEQLERKCRRLRLWCAAVTGLLLVACTAAALAPRENTIRAGRFEVVGKDDEVLAVLGGDLLNGGAGLQIGNFEDKHGIALLQVVPVKEKGTGRVSRAALLHLESSADPDPNIFTAYAFEHGAYYYVTNDYRSVGASIEPGLSRLMMTTTNEGNEPTGPTAKDDEEDHARLEFRIEGEKTSVTGSSAAGQVLFRQP